MLVKEVGMTLGNSQIKQKCSQKAALLVSVIVFLVNLKKNTSDYRAPVRNNRLE